MCGYARGEGGGGEQRGVEWSGLRAEWLGLSGLGGDGFMAGSCQMGASPLMLASYPHLSDGRFAALREE